MERRGVKAGLYGENENISHEGKIVWSVVEEIRKDGCGGVVHYLTVVAMVLVRRR